MKNNKIYWEMTKTELRNLLADGKINRVLTELRKLSADDIDLHNEVLQISAQFVENDRQRRLNITDPKDVGIEQNRINAVIILIIDRLPDDWLRKKGTPNWEKIALWVGILAAVAGFTGYTIKYFLSDKEKKEVEQDKADLKNLTESKKSDSLEIDSKASRNTSNKDKITPITSPTQEALKDRGEKINTKDVFIIESPTSNPAGTLKKEELDTPHKKIYKITLIVNNDWSDAKVMIDGQPAVIINDNILIKEIEVLEKKSSYEIKLEKVGMPPCIKTIKIVDNIQIIMPCK